jgi:hypothetical protein
VDCAGDQVAFGLGYGVWSSLGCQAISSSTFDRHSLESFIVFQYFM